MRGIKNVFYCVTHSPVVLGSMAAVLFTVALFLGLGHHGTQGRGLLYDSRGTVLCAFAIAAAVVVYEGENRIPTAAVSRGNGRATFYLSRILACHLLTACVYGLSVCGAAGWLKRPLTKDFFIGLAATLPFCLATTALILLLATVLRSMMAFITMAVLFAFVLWNGLGTDVEWFCSLFPPYLQMRESRTAVQYAVCAAWVLGALLTGLVMEKRRELK